LLFVNQWLLFDSGKCNPAFNMALDEALLETAANLGRPVLRFYGWNEPAASFGYFQKYAEVERATALRPLIRRPTGGGIVPHDADWTYSLVFPPDHEWYSLKAEESYRRVHEWIQSAFARLKVTAELAPAGKNSAPDRCFVGCVKSDLLWKGKKIAGAAQRRNRMGQLIQGSVQPPPVSPVWADWERAMREAGTVAERIVWSDFEPDAPLQARALSLAAQKYSQPEFITRR
jgi:lipoate-protein ligase A